MTTRLNPITTPRHELRAEKARRNKEAALDAFIGKKAEIDEMLARLQALSDDHFNCHPDEVNWAMVGTLEHYASLRSASPTAPSARANTPADLRHCRNSRRAPCAARGRRRRRMPRARIRRRR